MAKEIQVKHPSHYNKGKIEVWDFIQDQELDFFEGNIVKYICRLGGGKGCVREFAELIKSQYSN